MQAPLKNTLVLQSTADGYPPELAPDGFRAACVALGGMLPPRHTPAEKITGLAIVVLLHLAVGYALLKTMVQTAPSLPVEMAHLELVPAAARLPVAADPTPHEAPAPKPVVKPHPAPHPQPVEKKVVTPPRKQVAEPVKPVIAAPAETTAAAQVAPVQEAPAVPQQTADAAPSKAAAPASTAPAGGQGGKADIAETKPAGFDADYLHNPQPEYPRISRRMHETGRVMLRVQVSADGKPLQVEISKSSGFERLDRAAHDAVTRWKFIPARQGQQNITSWVVVPILFNLES